MAPTLTFHDAKTMEPITIPTANVRRVIDRYGVAVVRYVDYEPPNGTGNYREVRRDVEVCEPVFRVRQDVLAHQGDGLLIPLANGSVYMIPMTNLANITAELDGSVVVREAPSLIEYRVRDSFERMRELVGACPEAKFRFVAKPAFYDRRRRRPVGGEA